MAYCCCHHFELSKEYGLTKTTVITRHGGPIKVITIPLPESLEKMYETIAKYYVTTRTVKQVKNYYVNKRNGFAAVRLGALPRTLFNRCDGLEQLKTATFLHKSKSNNINIDANNMGYKW